MTEEMGLQTFPENRHWQCRRDFTSINANIFIVNSHKAMHMILDG